MIKMRRKVIFFKAEFNRLEFRVYLQDQLLRIPVCFTIYPLLEGILIFTPFLRV